jgi:hypothetical protein
VSDDQELIPIEQHTLTFYGKPIIVVRLPDGLPGVVLRFLCENLHIDTNAQVQHVQRSEAMAEDLVFTRVETPGGAQCMATLVLRSIAYWFATIDTRRMEKDDPRLCWLLSRSVLKRALMLALSVLFLCYLSIR